MFNPADAMRPTPAAGLAEAWAGGLSSDRGIEATFSFGKRAWICAWRAAISYEPARDHPQPPRWICASCFVALELARRFLPPLVAGAFSLAPVPELG